jgi:acetolactate decarboxylase
MKIIKSFFVLTILLFVNPLIAQTVQSIGAAKLVMTGADLSNKVFLDTLVEQPGLYAVGPVDNLQGEITVFNSRVITSTVVDGQIVTAEQPGVMAPFLAYAYVEEWQVVTFEASIKGLKELEKLMDSLAQIVGIHADSAFPFLIYAPWQMLEYHIIMRDLDESTHSHEAHKKAKVKFRAGQTPGHLVGFFSRHHEGIFTHKGQFIHVHFLSDNEEATGHLDYLEHIGKIEVYLPIIP